MLGVHKYPKRTVHELGRIIRVVDLGSNFGRGKIFERKKQKDRMNFHLLSWPIEHYLNTLVVLKITCLH